MTIYTGIVALAVNLVVGFAVTALVRMGKRGELPDETEPGDYEVEAGDRGVGPLPRPRSRSRRCRPTAERG